MTPHQQVVVYLPIGAKVEGPIPIFILHVIMNRTLKLYQLKGAVPYIPQSPNQD